MSKEFQDERKKLGLTGRQLTAKYQKEGKSIEKGVDKRKIYTEKELLDILTQSCKDLGRPPTQLDFSGNNEYPVYATYRNRFGSWNNALKLVGLDVDTRIAQGYIKTEKEKGRYTEIVIRKILYDKGIDVSGKSCNSYYDGMCPKGQLYEVKSSKLYLLGYWSFYTKNKDKDDNREAIQWYYFAAFNKDYTKLIHLWKVPGEIVENDEFYIGMKNSGTFNIENMEQYDITDKFKKIAIDTNNEILKRLL